MLPGVLAAGLGPWLPRRHGPELGPAVPIDVSVVGENRIVRMDLEEYFKGVVAAEMPASFPPEALRAQAVIARTYAVVRIRVYGGIVRSFPARARTYAVVRMRVFGGPGSLHHPGADSRTEHTRTQAWRSEPEMRHSWGPYHAGRYRHRIQQAVKDTAGLIV